jgi:GGDEF domain-containing protein
MGVAERSAGRTSYTRSRQLVLATGIGLLILVAAITYARGVEPKEVTATILFLPIFVALVFGKLPGGLIAGIAAAIVYAAVRYPDIQAVGADKYAGLIWSRAAAFIAFGAIGGWASRQLDASVTKLELYDTIDDETGLFNARFFLQDTDLEMTRSRRYKTIFSVGVVDIPAEALSPLSRRQRVGLLREVGRILKDSIRTVDRAIHAPDSVRNRIAIVLPETAREGAHIFTDRLRGRLEEYLNRRGVSGIGSLSFMTLTLPEDETALNNLREEFKTVDRSEHPEPEAEVAAAPAAERRHE